MKEDILSCCIMSSIPLFVIHTAVDEVEQLVLQQGM